MRSNLECSGMFSLEAFKAKLDVALGSLVWWLATLHIGGGLKLDDHCGSFQPRPFYDSMILVGFDLAVGLNILCIFLGLTSVFMFVVTQPNHSVGGHVGASLFCCAMKG